MASERSEYRRRREGRLGNGVKNPNGSEGTPAGPLIFLTSFREVSYHDGSYLYVFPFHNGPFHKAH